MIPYLLDTDHVSLHAQGHMPLLLRLASLRKSDHGVSLVTAEETLRGRVAVLNRRMSSAERVRAYALFHTSLDFFRETQVAPFDQACEDQFQQLLGLRLRAGPRGLQIAATALVNRPSSG